MADFGVEQAFYRIWRGSFPDVALTDGRYWSRFYDSYLATYIQRDVRDFIGINDPLLSAFYVGGCSEDGSVDQL